ncbi:tetratricopeptide repeat protein [Microbulbifer hydrolyticus]|uniref:Flp pilus assembly protein TadD/nitrate/TMAO reductase-like tetraheme cytochrome c subunit n=1 Tax=Microbulbifer hydrolyticus TaxID=48074 RepID=A0A6P1T7C7_9GAMM|nr:tetratricopeptide repeat protein [Microbulbifer hydrolyticus]MBB5210845.1 Flp pilus assembly protein TadD/nitrate/TMAO reductase-like tetraheme cytochrome c subunit [Microbulbifer hydrolyticus]QHQ38724.1 tetratricopeptide repeat protein [Microbulbifer hydrolyticus]
MRFPWSILLLPLLLLLAACDKNSDTEQVSADASYRQQGAKKSAIEPPSGEQRTASAASSGTTAVDAGYVGAEQCGSCHQAEFDDWKKSHHDLAMKVPNETTVVGDFNNTSFKYYGTESRFYKKDGKYFVRTDGPDGELHDYPVAYTFGIHPLQQYLIALPGGRLQALSVSWDSRSKEEGGQRWFHLYPDEEIKPGDPLHWTGINQNWNFQCADCHSTNLHKNYNADTESFDTQWAEMNVGCEACHGPGEKHVQWAALPEVERSVLKHSGFEVSYRERLKAHWNMDPKSGIAHLKNVDINTQQEISTCAQCHSRRGTQFPGAKPHDKFLDFFHPALLDENLYHADGQIDDEVYVWGSFLQSKMHGAGVTCSNCHNPHSLKTRVEGNGLCAQCHMPTKFDTAEHHFHPQGSEGAQCVSCHMPTKTYMQVDARRDHSFRVPRPDLSDKIGSPNACIGCHVDESNQWAADILQEKFGAPDPHYGEAIHAGRTGAPDAEGRLLKLVMDDTQPEIVRATAVSLLPSYLSQTSAQVLQVIAQGDSELQHLGMARALDRVPQQVRPALAIPLLYEDERVTAALAGDALAGAPMGGYPEEVGKRFNAAISDYVAAAEFNSDRPESLANLAALRAREGNQASAEQLLSQAIELAPYYTPAVINLADLYRASGRESDSETLLREAMDHSYDKAPLQHTLGLSLVRQKKMPQALEMLRTSAHADSATPRYVYVYGIALNSQGKPQEAIRELEQGLERFPGDRQILSALVSIHHEQGNEEEARRYQQQLQ